jgi:phosphopantothenoylcysteine decarboxylase/phosphopantothenate--cysteine ligase
MSLKGKKILVGLTGGIACYKVPYLVRFLVKAGADVRVMMTPNATKFITTLTMETVSKHAVAVHMFPEEEFASTHHIELATWPDLVVIAPATANFLGKVASGVSDDLLTTVMCASDRPVLMAPAMNPNMWQNKITQRNFETVTKQLGWQSVGPDEGQMAEDQWGIGRMVEPDELFEAVKKFFGKAQKKKSSKVRRSS